MRDAHGRVNPRDYGDYQIASDQERARLAALIEYAKDHIESAELFARIAACKPEYWTAMTDAASTELRKRMRRRQLGGSPRMFPPGNIEYLLRTGYVVRRIDEALGEEPRSREELDRDVVAEHERYRRVEAKRPAFDASGKRLSRKTRSGGPA